MNLWVSKKLKRCFLKFSSFCLASVENKGNFTSNLNAADKKKKYFDLMHKISNEEKPLYSAMKSSKKRIIDQFCDERWLEADNIPLNKRFVPKLVRNNFLILNRNLKKSYFLFVEWSKSCI